MYRLFFYESKALLQDRKKLQRDSKMLGFIQEALGELAVDPFSASLDLKKLKGAPSEGTFRLRCGKWRILFDVDTSNKTIIIYRIMQRKEGY
jgi:mRNA-degrading endonuclease RelE of RelBE toxin-antitoxin system